MNLPTHPPCRSSARRRGFAVILLLGLLAVMSSFTLNNSRMLFHLEQELKTVEQEQRARLASD